MKYSEAVAFLRESGKIFCKPGTERVRALCAAVGNPGETLPVIHVAGTNGKGSFCVILASLLSAGGFRTGRFSSPALCRINECITVDNEPIPDEDFARLIGRLKPYAEGAEDRPTEFEILTVAALLFFKEKKCDYVILECGMGGLTDATNVIDRPLLSVITGVSVDHTAFLGKTVEEIARQKAGIVKEGCPVLWCGSDPTAENVLRRVSVSRSAPLYFVPRATLRIKKTDLSGTVFDFDSMTDLPLSLLGLYQADNAANALTAVKILGVPLLREALEKGLSSVRWPGRFEILRREPLLIADGGHNPEGVDRTVESIEAYFPEEKVVFVSGIMADKDYRRVAARMATVAEKVFTVTPDNPRSLSAEAFAEVFRSLGIPAIPCPSVAEALSRAERENLPTVCLGSLYMYGDVKAQL